MAKKSLATNEAQRPEHKEFFELSGRYVIDPATDRRDMLNDVGCLLESAEAIINSAAAEIQDLESWRSLFPDLPGMLYGALNQVRMSRNLCDAAFSAPDGEVKS